MNGDAHTWSPARRGWAPLLLLSLVSTLGCDDGFDLGRQPGLRGSPCDFQEDCEAPAVCAKVAEYQWPVCTGTAPVGGPCLVDAECRFERKDGLPLQCTGGRCAFPKGPATPDAAGGD